VGRASAERADRAVRTAAMYVLLVLAALVAAMVMAVTWLNNARFRDVPVRAVLWTGSG
jgi:hypothetical protein